MRTREFIRELRDEKSKLLQELRQKEGAPVSEQGIDRVDSRDRIPVSPTQFGLWFLNQLEGGKSITYNTTSCFVISGKLDRDAFSKSLDAIYNRHNTLRTTFESLGGEPYQIIGPTGSFPLEYVDLRVDNEGERDAKLEKIKLIESETPFDLESGPCVRAILIQLSDLKYYFIITIHHILTDGWSLGVFRKELSILYGSFVAKRESPLPVLSVQYSDYSIRNRAERRRDFERGPGYDPVDRVSHSTRNGRLIGR